MRCLNVFCCVCVLAWSVGSQAASVFVVFDIDGRSSQIEPQTLSSLTDCLTASVAIHSGKEVVLRDQVHAVLSNSSALADAAEYNSGSGQKDSAPAEKKDETKEANNAAVQANSQTQTPDRANPKKDAHTPVVCYDYQCQVRVAKKLQADSIIATTIHKLGGYCYVTASVSDLKRPVAKHMAKVKIGCSDGELVEAMEAIAKQIAAGLKHATSVAAPAPASAAAKPAKASKSKKRGRRKKR